MKLAEFYDRIKQDEWLRLRNINVRFYIIAFFLLMAYIFLPFLGLQGALLPITVVCLIGLMSAFFHLAWEIRGKTLHYGLYFTSFIDVLFITIGIHYLGGIETWFSWVYAVALIAISTVRGLRIGIYVAVLSSLMNSALMIGEFTGVIPHVPYKIADNSALIVQGKFYLYIRLLGDTILFILTAAVSGILSERLKQKSDELEKKNIEILAMQEKLQEHARGLENVVEERTEELSGANKDLEQSLSLLTATLESTADGILVVDNEGKIASFNQKFTELWRIPDSILETRDDEQAISFVLSQLSDPEAFLKKVRELYSQPEADSFDVLEFKDGRVFERYSHPQLVGGESVGRVWSFRDVTEKTKLEEQLLHAQKMESIGTLAGGIAHDFNNLLAGILGYASLMKGRINKDDPFFKYVDIIEKSSTRAAELTDQLLAFARGGKYHVKSVDLNRIVDETLKIIARTLDKSIDIETELATELPTVEADSGQLQQALMNLCVNAGDAMPAGGALTITTSIEEISKDEARVNIEAEPGQYVMVSISDTGFGMDAGTIARIFEPFFTTKEEGKGTGLGLSMVYGVVSNHGGFINVQSEPGHGTTFKAYLPISGKPEVRKPRDTEAPRGGTETILVVDDEESFRSFARDTLEHHGYKILLAADGQSALDTYRQKDGEIGLVILDMVMPRMGGHETYLRMRALNPDVRVLLSTGYSQEGKAKEIIDSGVKGFIQKPYKVDILLSKVRGVLDADN